MFAKSFILFATVWAIAVASPEPKADPKADPLLVSTYSAGLPLVNTYTAAAVPLVNTYAAHAYTHDHAHALPVHAARTITYNTAGLRTVAIDAPVVQTVGADVPVTYSAVNPLHFAAVSSPVAARVLV